jgi:FkbM family methyltransferase
VLLVSPLRRRLANRLPQLGSLLRLWRAVYDTATPTRKSYAEHGEDEWVVDALRGRDLTSGIYVDVGAFHPSRMSNTYRLYRQGLHGVLVEPNPELVRLLRWFRPRDVVIAAGCDAVPSARPLFLYTTPADSSFSEARIARNEIEKGLRRRASPLVPLLPLDAILAAVVHEWVYFLSIDAEGLDDRVLEGASRVLEKTFLVCVETLPTNPGIEARVLSMMEHARFELVHAISHNRFFRSTRLR